MTIEIGQEDEEFFNFLANIHCISVIAKNIAYNRSTISRFM